MEKLIPRVTNGVPSETHFLYTDSKGREWSVVDFAKMMSSVPDSDVFNDFHYKWEGMYFGEEKIGGDQFRGMDAEEVLEQIENLAQEKPNQSPLLEKTNKTTIFMRIKIETIKDVDFDLRKEMGRFGYSFRSLSKKTGLDATYISRIANGLTVPEKTYLRIRNRMIEPAPQENKRGE